MFIIYPALKFPVSKYSDFAKHAKDYLKYLGVPDQLAVHFVDLPDEKEAVVNHLFCNHKGLYLNGAFFEGMSTEYALLIILHEIFHTVKQGITRWEMVTYLLDTKQWEVMQALDIEADLQVAIYMHHIGLISDFNNYLSILHTGCKTFRDSSLRMVKLERFIGSMLAIEDALRNGRNIIYLPHFGCVRTVIKATSYTSSHMRVHFLPPDHEQLSQWQQAYQGGQTMSNAEYVDRIHQLTTSLLNTLKTD